MIDAAWLDRGFSTTAEDGYSAEFYPDGRLAHFGYYEQGVCRLGLFLDAEEALGRAERVQVEFYPEGGPDYSLASDEQRFGEWVRGWIDRVYTAPHEHHLQRCSFCKKSEDEVQRLVAGSDTAICDACVALCNKILDEEAVGA